MKPESTMDPDSAPGPVRVDVTANRRARRLDGALRGLDDRRRQRIEADNLRRAQTDRCEALGLARRKRQWTPARGAHRCAATPDRLGVDVGMLLRRARIDQRPDDSAGHRARRRADRGRRQPCLNRTRNNASDAPFID